MVFNWVSSQCVMELFVLAYNSFQLLSLQLPSQKERIACHYRVFVGLPFHYSL